jgi:ferredoxin
MRTTIKIDRARCNLCGTCAAVCPMEILKAVAENVPGQEELRITTDDCVACDACEMVCGEEALKIEHHGSGS